jgi:hypothetical protein
LQEPFRWIADAAVVDAFESGVLDLPDFYFTGDDYRYRFETEALRRFLGFLRERFNMGVRYGGRVLRWDTVIERKVIELARYLVGRVGRLGFSEPSPTFRRTDNLEIRRRILSVSQSEARRLGIGRSTLHQLRKNAASERSFGIYRKVAKRLESG